MLIADGNDLNPTMIARWQTYLERTRKVQHDPVSPLARPGRAAGEGLRGAGQGTDRPVAGEARPGKPLNPLVARSLGGAGRRHAGGGR